MRFDTPTRAAAFMARTSFRACASFALIHLLANPAAAQSIAGATVSAGSASVSGVGSTNVTVAQTSDKAVIDWRAFSVDAGTTVTFRQPGASSIALNRITGSGTTRIDGSLVANGQVWLLNPNGVLIGAGGSVAAGGFLASTHAMSNADFMAGHYQLTSDGTGTAGVVNLGSIVAAEGGYAVLAGNQVGNAGLVQARLGTVALGAGKTMVLDVVGDKLLSFAVTEPLSVVASSGAMVDNRGVLSAQGGQVLLTARAAAGVVGSVINTSGLIDATAVSTQGGTIVLDGGDTGLVYAAGTLDASGKAAGQTGGTIGVFGDSVVAGAGALLDASGYAGGGAINVGGGWQGASIGGHASSVRAGLAASATLDASALSSGNGGTLTLWSDVTNSQSQTLAYGTILARGGMTGGDGGRIETSGHYLDTTGVRGSAAAVSGAAGLWLFDPYDVEIVGSGANIVNPGFENGTVGWTAVGDAGSTTTVTTASSYAGTRNGQTYTASTFTSPVSAGGSFARATAGTVDTGNGLSQTFNATAGQTFNLYALFLGMDYSTFDDAASIVITGPGNYSQTLYSQAISAGHDFLTVPWQQQLVTLPQTGSYTITATVKNVMDGSNSSQLGFELATGSMNGAFSPSSHGQTWTPTNTLSQIDVSQITGFLNTGTSVQITTTGAGTEAGNITVDAAIAKTAGTAATLQLDALGGIVVNQAIGSTVGALNVVLNAGAGGIALNAGVNTNTGSLTLNTTGATTQTMAFTTGALALNGAGGTYALTDAGNNFGTLTGNTGSISIANAASATTLGTLTTSNNLAIRTAGSVSQSGALTSNTLALNGTGGTYALTNASNSVGTLSGNTESVALVDTSALTLSGLTTGGALTVNDTGALTIGGAVSVGATSQLTASQAITIANGGGIATSAGTLALVAGTNFVDQAGANAITTAGGARWLIYSQAPANDTFGGLVSGNNAIWGTTATTTPPSSVTATGNRYVFAQSPTITVTPTDTHKTYGDTLTATGVTFTTATGAGYTATGMIDASAYGNVFIQDVRTGTPGVVATNNGLAATAFAGGTYQLTATQGNLAAPQGYNFAFGNATLAIDPRSLILNATTATKVYDGYTTTNAAPTYSGLANTDTVTNLSESFDSRNAGSRTLAVNAGYTVNDGNGGHNYTVTLQNAAGTISQRALIASIIGSVAKTYDGGVAATLAAGNYSLANTVANDSVALNNPTSGVYDDKNVATGKTVTVTGLSLTGSDATNYTVNASANAAIGSITAKPLAASLIGSVSKVYDGGTAATLASGNYALTGGVVSGDTVMLNNPTVGSYDTKDVATGKTVSVTGLALTGASAGNYTVNTSASAAIGTITAKALAASLTGSVSKVYDGGTAATLTSGNYALTGGVVSGDTVMLNNPTAGSYDTKDATTGKTVSVTGLALTGASAGNYTVNTSASAAIGTITAKALAASLTGSVSKVYDGGTAATLASGNYALTGGVVSGDTVMLNNPTAGSYDTKDATTGKTVSVTGLALTGASAGNYTVNASASAAIGSITAKALAASLIGSVSKVYDGGTAATLASGNYALTGGVVSGDTVMLNNPTVGSYDTKDVATGKTVSVTGLALTGASADNYTVNTSASAAIGTITAKALAASLTGSVSKVYDGGTAATLASGNYALTGGVVSGDTVMLNNPTAGSYDTKDATTGKTVSVTGLALTGASAGNYTVNTSASAAIGTITAKALAASLTGSVSKVYDGGTAATLTSGNYVLTGAVVNDQVALNDPTTGTYDTKAVATGKTVSVTGLALTGSDATNYTVNADASAAIGTITAKTLAASLIGNVAKTYDGSTAATLADANYVLTGAVSGDAVALNDPTAGTYDTKNAGTGKSVAVTGLALTGADASNYTVNVGTSAAIGSIAAKALAASLTGSVAKTYDGSTTATLADANYVLTGAVSGDTVALNDPTAGTYDTRNAGTGKTVAVAGLALTGADAGNYTVNAGTSAAVGTIAAKTLAASLTGSVAKTYDGSTAATLGAANYVLTGAVANDAVTLNDPTAGTYDSRNVGTSKTVAVTGLALIGADAGNYTVNTGSSAAIGSIAAKALAASLTGSVAKTYDGSTTATLADTNYVLTGAVSGDAVALNDPAAGTYDTRNAGTGKTVAVAGLALTGADAGNYTVNAGTSAAIGVVTAKALAATLTGGVSKVYDGGTTATLASGNYVLTGAVSGDAVALNDPTAGTYDTRNAATGKTVAVAGLALTGADAGNYTVNAGTSSAIGTITAKALAASLTGIVSKVYDGGTTATLASGNYVLTGAVANDAVALNGPVSGTYDTKNVGTAKTVAVTGIALTGTDAGNYTVNAATSAAIGTITAKALAVSLVGTVAKTANGGTDAALTPDNFLLAGFVSGEGATVGQTSGNYANASAGTGIVVTTTLAASNFAPAAGTALSNYVLPVGAVSGPVGTINPAIIIVAQTPVTPPAAVIAAIAATAVLPATSVPVPVADSTSTQAVSVAAAVTTVAVNVDRSPPSPVAAQKPPTPVDSADAGDPILASVSEPPSEKPASHAVRQSSITVPIAGGLLAQQQTLPSRGNTVPGVDQAFSGGGGVF